jgi:squalene-hopene/tetraprenyl-beta-curcumene cyclase
MVRGRTLKLLTRIQPTSGGFLEATPLTSFVVMSLAAAGQADHPVVKRGVDFIAASVREDGSWPIDTNLATWVTTLAVNALAAGPDFDTVLPEAERKPIREWLLGQQYRVEHPYTLANPGGGHGQISAAACRMRMTRRGR